MAKELTTGRGVYRVTLAAPAETLPGVVLLTVTLERADGIERVVFRCRIAETLAAQNGEVNPERLAETLIPWLQREFEQTREAALKSIRTTRTLYEIAFDQLNRGPF